MRRFFRYFLAGCILFFFLLFPGLVVAEKRVVFERDWELEVGTEITSSLAYKDGLLVFGTEAVGEGKVIAVNALSGDTIWSFNTGEMVRSSPVIYGDSVFVGSEDHNPSGPARHSGTLHALNLRDGKQIWERKYDYLAFASPYPWRKRLFYTAGVVEAIDINSGDTIWEYNPPGNATSSPVVVDGMVYLGTSDPSHVIALDAENGSLKWKTPVEYFIDASPAVYDETIFIGDWSRTFYAIDARTGEIIWEHKHTPRGTSGIFTSAIVWNDKVFYGNYQGELVGADTVSGDTVWQHRYSHPWLSSPALDGNILFWPNFGERSRGEPPGYLYALNPLNGNILGRVEVGKNVISSPLVKNSRIYVASGKGNQGGAIKSFSYRMLDVEEKSYLSPETYPKQNFWLADNVLLISENKELKAIDLDNEELIWSTEFDYGSANHLFEKNGKLVVGSYDHRIHLYELDSGENIWSKKLLGEPLGFDPVFIDEMIVFASSRGVVTAVEAETGKIIWSKDTEWSATGLDVAGERLLVTTAEGMILYLEPDSGKKIHGLEQYDGIQGLSARERVTYLHGKRKLYAADLVGEAVYWSYEHGFGIATELIFKDGRIYFADWAGIIHAVDEKTGEQIWQRDSGRALHGDLLSSDNLLFAFNRCGEFYVLDKLTGEKIKKVKPSYRFYETIILSEVQKMLENVVGKPSLVDKYKFYYPGYSGRRMEQRLVLEKPSIPTDSLGILEEDKPVFPPLASDRQLFIPQSKTLVAYRVFREAEETGYFRGNRQRTGHFGRLRTGQGLEKIWKLELDGELIRPPLLTPKFLFAGSEDSLGTYCRDSGELLWSWSPANGLSDFIFQTGKNGLYALDKQGMVYRVGFDKTVKKLNLPVLGEEAHLYNFGDYLAVISGSGTVRVIDSYYRRILGKFESGTTNRKVSSPGFDGDNIFYPVEINDKEAVIYKIALQDLRVKEKYSLPSRAEKYHLQAEDGRLYAYLETERWQNNFIVFDIDSGEKIWSDCKAEHMPVSPPLVWNDFLIQQVVDLMPSARLIYREADSGRIVEEYLLKEEVKNDPSAYSPVLSFPYLYLFGSDNIFRAYELDGNR